jgi:hypothetical protein
MKKIILTILLLNFALSAHATYLPNLPNMIADYENGAFEDFSTADTWYKNTNWDNATIFSNFSADLANGDFYYIGTNPGDYFIVVNSSVRAPTGVLFTQGIFKNDTAIDTFSREMTAGPERPLSYLNLSTIGSETQDIKVSSDSSTYADAYTNFTSTAIALDAVAEADGRYYHVNEGNSTPGFVIKIQIDNVDIPSSIRLFNSGYDGANHNVKMRAWNATLASYTSMTDSGSDFYDVGALPGPPGEYSYRDFKFPSPRVDFVDSGIVTVLVYHETSGNIAHDAEFDKIVLVDGLNSIPFPSFHRTTLTNGDKISVRFKSDLADSEVVLNHVEIFILKINN